MRMNGKCVLCYVLWAFSLLSVFSETIEFVDVSSEIWPVSKILFWLSSDILAFGRGSVALKSFLQK